MADNAFQRDAFQNGAFQEPDAFTCATICAGGGGSDAECFFPRGVPSVGGNPDFPSEREREPWHPRVPVLPPIPKPIRVLVDAAGGGVAVGSAVAVLASRTASRGAGGQSSGAATMWDESADDEVLALFATLIAQ